MTHKIWRFGTVDLPLANAAFDAGSAPSRAGFIPTADGTAFDAWGTAQAGAQYPYDLAVRCEVVEASTATIRTTLDALRGLRGQRLKLYRMMFSDGTAQWAYARLMRVPAQRDWRNVYQQPVDLQFQVLTPWFTAYHGQPWTLDAGESLDTGLYLDTAETHTLSASPTSISLANAGNAAAWRVQITVTAGSADITSVNVKVGDCSWTYSGTLYAGDALIVNGDTWRVTNDGADAWAAFDLDAAHVARHWFEIAPGGSTVTVTFSGGSTDSTIAFHYWETWE